jgi:hypothetical protein
MMPLRRFAGCLAAAAILAHGQAAGRPAAHEFELEAAFVYNFILFTDWPAAVLAEGGAVSVCVNPDSATRPALAELQNRHVKGRRIVLRLLPDPESAGDCHVLFLDSQDRERWAKIKRRVAGASVLTVSDDGDIGRDGAVILLSVHDSRMGFEVDLAAARQAKLVLSSKLLRLSRAIR